MTKGAASKTIVVKIGTKVLTKKATGLDKTRMKELVGQVSEVKKDGVKVVLVSSGAIVCGMGLLGYKRRPSALSELQACAAVGQSHLMQAYDDFFNAHGILTAQVLLTQADLNDRKRYVNAKHTLLTLLNKGVVPIVNENDTVSTEEIKFGDNDKLSSLVAHLVEAEQLILLSDVDGLHRCDRNKKMEKDPIAVVAKISDEIECMAKKCSDDLGKGGMASKIEAARTVTTSGIACTVANGGRANVLIDIIRGEEVGTRFLPASSKLAAKKRWVGFSVKPKGEIRVDSGARDALAKKNKSLLSSGIIATKGEFQRGDIVRIADSDGAEFARGIVNYSSGDLSKIKGLKTGEIQKVLGCKIADEVVHRDNLVIL